MAALSRLLGKFIRTFNFEYLSGLPFNNLVIEVTTANNAVLKNADGAPGGVGSVIAIDNATLPDTVSPGSQLFDETETLSAPLLSVFKIPPGD